MLKSKKILSVLLAVMMAVSCMAVSAFAEDEEDSLVGCIQCIAHALWGLHTSTATGRGYSRCHRLGYRQLEHIQQSRTGTLHLLSTSDKSHTFGRCNRLIIGVGAIRQGLARCLVGEPAQQLYNLTPIALSDELIGARATYSQKPRAPEDMPKLHHR